MNRSLIQIATFMAASLSVNAIKLTTREEYEVSPEAKAVGEHMKELDYDDLTGLTDYNSIYDKFYGHLDEFRAGNDAFD